MTRSTVKGDGRGSKAARTAKAQTNSLILAAHGRHYLAQCPDGSHVQAFPRGKKSEVAVGDLVALEQVSPGQAAIHAIGPRRNLLHRSDQFRSKLLAANVDRVIIVLATEPGFSEDLLGRALVAAEALDIEPLIVLNKTDLLARLETARSRLAPYAALGYQVVEVSVRKEPDAALAALWTACHGRRSILIGQSGMGKSSLLNLLIPDAAAQTREISEKLDSGKHTTTFTRLYRMPAAAPGTHAGVLGEGAAPTPDSAGELIDSPGFQEFGLYHLGDRQIAEFFPEFRPHLGQCRFYNCTHVHEPGCAILQACGTNTFSGLRHALYAQLLHEMSQRLPY